MVACTSLELFAACHALHHCLKLSHPPNRVGSNLHLCSVSLKWTWDSSPKIIFELHYKGKPLSTQEILINSWVNFLDGPVGIRTRDPRLAGAMLYRTKLQALKNNLVSVLKNYKKEVIQLQVPLQLPCDDLTLLAEFRFELIKVNPHLNSARMVWRAVCAKSRDIFTGTCWIPITRDSIVMKAGYSLQFELG